jgi:hypothetical protein
MTPLDLTGCFARLGLPPDSDTRSIKRAYAKALKLIDTATEPERFAQLRQDYEQALAIEGARKSTDVELHAEDVPDPIAGESFGRSESVNPSAAEPVSAASDADAETAFADDEPYVFESELPSVDAPAPEELIERLERSATFASDNVAAAIMALRGIIETDAMISLVRRDVFEVLLVDALRLRRFGACNGAVLLAAAEVFGWRLDGARHLSRMGFSGSIMNAVLDEVSQTSQARLQRMLLLSGEPTTASALRLWKPEQEINAHTPLGSVLFPPGHLERWAQAHAHAPLVERSKRGLYKFLGSRTVWRAAVALLIIPVALAIFALVLSRVTEGEARQASVECQRAFAAAQRTRWKNIALSSVGTLQKCAAQLPPENCADKEGLLVVTAIANRLIPRAGDQDLRAVSYYVLMPYEAIRLNLDDGRSFGPSEGGSCDGVESFINAANWLAEGDEPAARRLIETAASCRHKSSGSYQRLSPTLYTFLEHTDAWPAPEGGAQIARYRLKDLVGPARPIDVASARAAIGSQYPWAACKTN